MVLVVNDPLSSVEIEPILQNIGETNLTIFRSSDSCKDYLNAVSILPDLVLIDINLEGNSNGLQLADEIKHLSIPLIFLSFKENQAQYDKIKAFRPVAFLGPNFNGASIQTAIDAARHASNSNENLEKTATEDSMFLRQNNQFIRLYFKDILWVKSDGNYCIIKTETRRFIIKKSLVKFYQELPKDDFIQVHRRYVVQFSVIDRVDIQTNSAFVGEEEVSIGGKFKAALVKRLKGE